jgi:hypothetical protein
MKNLNSEETLWVILPILLVVGILIASIIILPKTQTETRSKASEPTAVPTKAVISSPTKIEVVCSSLYSPVCGQNDQTYPNECEANQAGVTVFTQGACTPIKTTPSKVVSPTPKTLPVAN